MQKQDEGATFKRQRPHRKRRKGRAALDGRESERIVKGGTLAFLVHATVLLTAITLSAESYSAPFILAAFGFLHLIYALPALIIFKRSRLDRNYIKGAGLISAFLVAMNTAFCGCLILF